MCSAGSAMDDSSPRPTASTAIGRRATKRTQRRLTGSRRRSLREPWPSTRLTRVIRSPMKPSSAGSSVSATSTAIVTVPAAARPITVRNGMLTTVRPTSAITTVAPANTTAPPAVAGGLRRRSAIPIPAPMFCRWRARMNSA